MDRTAKHVYEFQSYSYSLFGTNASLLSTFSSQPLSTFSFSFICEKVLLSFLRSLYLQDYEAHGRPPTLIWNGGRWRKWKEVFPVANLREPLFLFIKSLFMIKFFCFLLSSCLCCVRVKDAEGFLQTYALRGNFKGIIWRSSQRLRVRQYWSVWKISSIIRGVSDYIVYGVTWELSHQWI